MNCPNCSIELPGNAKFCIECGANIEILNSNVCSKCGENLKPEARFCQNCGEGVKTQPSQFKSASGPASQGETGVKQSWLHSFGAFLFIPIFAGIIVLLFWVNKEPEQLSASNPANGEQAAPDMAAMGDVHNTLERLKRNLAADSTDIVSMDSLAIMYSIAGSYEKALTFYEMHLKVEPDNKDVKIAIGLTYHNLSRSDEAIAIMNEILQEEPTNAFGLHYLAEIQSSLHNHEEAEQAWQKIIDNYPGTEMARMAQQRIHETSHEEQSN